MRYLFLVSIMFFLSTEGQAQLHYTVKSDVLAARCADSIAVCTLRCGDENMFDQLDEGQRLYYERINYDSDLLRTVSDDAYKCITIKKEDIDFWSGPIRPDYFTWDAGPGLDANIDNTSLSFMLNAFVSSYFPLRRLDKAHWLVGGIRTGASYGVVLTDTDPIRNGETLFKVFKTEVLLGRYSRESETNIALAAGISPINFRDGQRINQVLPHVSLTLTKDVSSFFNSPKKR